MAALGFNNTFIVHKVFIHCSESTSDISFLLFYRGEGETQRGEMTCLNIWEQLSIRSENRSSLSGLTCHTLDLLISNWKFALFVGVTLRCLHSMWLFIIQQ